MSSTEKPHRGSPYAQALITHLQPYSTVRHLDRGSSWIWWLMAGE